MYERIMKWVGEHILLAPFMMLVVVFLCGCRAQKVFTVREKKTVSVRQREIPVFTPKASVTLLGKIKWNRELSRLELTDVNTETDSPSRNKPTIKAEIDEDGNLKVTATNPADTLNAIANDSIISETVHEKESDRIPWWKQTLMYVGGFAVVIILCKFVLRKEHNKIQAK